jgi:hypothetical protein
MSFFLLSFLLFSQKNEQTVLRLSTATKTNSEPAANSPLQRGVKKGHDVYTFTLTANENGSLNLADCFFWVKDLTTLPIHFQKDVKLKALKFKKGEVITLVAEAKGINPYQKPPKKIATLGLISCMINGEKAYIEVKTVLED